MTYSPTIPTALDALSQSQGDIQTNFAQINTIFQLNHVEFNNAVVGDRGKHKQVNLSAPGRTRQGEAPCRSPKGNLSLSGEKANLGRGFILKRGKIKNDVSIKVLLARARRELEIGLAKELFEN
jgi:hypothetical protein